MIIVPIHTHSSPKRREITKDDILYREVFDGEDDIGWIGFLAIMLFMMLVVAPSFIFIIVKVVIPIINFIT